MAKGETKTLVFVSGPLNVRVNHRVWTASFQVRVSEGVIPW